MTSILRETAFWVAVALCFVAQVAITRSALSSTHAQSPADVKVPRPSRLMETAWTIVPAIALALVLGATWQLMQRPASNDDAAPAPAAGHVHPGS